LKGQIVYLGMQTYPESNPIARWAESDRPREKLLEKGRGLLSDAELIAILIGSGTVKESAVELARRLLDLAGNSLAELARLDVHELMKIKGVGPAKAVSVMAALELANRRMATPAKQKPRVTSSSDAFHILKAELCDASYEVFWMLLLNRANRLLSKVQISEGGFSGTVADPKKIFKMALERKASSIILAHNHPSGNLKPSEADIRLTRKLKSAGEMLDLPVLDHIIAGEQGYYSFSDEGTL
jgi:DNA repair protein RadC